MAQLENKINPEEDGISHLNVFSRGRTELGQLLTNFAFTPFKHPQFGHFASVEGFWYWLGTGCQHDNLRSMYGSSAKFAGRKYQRVNFPDFQKEICVAIECKIRQNPKILKLLKTTPILPLRHYYVFGYKPANVVEKSEHNWMLDVIERLWKEQRGDAENTSCQSTQ